VIAGENRTEGSLVLLHDNNLVCYFRQPPSHYLSGKAISQDGGKSWRTTGVPFIGHRPCAGMLSSGTILVTFRYPGAGTWAYLEAEESARCAESWDRQQGQVLQLEPGGGNYWWDYGYSGWVQLPDSRVFCVYYTKAPVSRLPSPEPKPFIRGVWLSE
jgi:hypothetical protein